MFRKSCHQLDIVCVQPSSRVILYFPCFPMSPHVFPCFHMFSDDFTGCHHRLDSVCAWTDFCWRKLSVGVKTVSSGGGKYSPASTTPPQSLPQKHFSPRAARAGLKTVGRRTPHPQTLHHFLPVSTRRGEAKASYKKVELRAQPLTARRYPPASHLTTRDESWRCKT